MKFDLFSLIQFQKKTKSQEMRKPTNQCNVCHQDFISGSTYFVMEGYFICEKPICILCCEKQVEETKQRQQARDEANLKGPYAHFFVEENKN